MQKKRCKYKSERISEKDRLEQLAKRLNNEIIKKGYIIPDDKIPVIGPCVDKIIYVKNENKRRIAIAEFEDKEIEKLINGGL